MKKINDKSKEKPLLIYLHIPKTGGTTLTQIICNQYKNNYHHYPGDVFSYNERMSLADTLCGHLPFGAHSYIPRPFTYITLLRNPIEQVISWFYFRYKSPHYDPFEGDFEKYIGDEQFNSTTVNLQTRFLCGKDEPSLETAKNNLMKYFSIVGVTELFDESIFLMKKELGWRNINYKKQNVNYNRPQQNFPQSVINKVIKKNEIDIQLYEFAKKMLEERINSLDSKSQHQLSIFKSSLLK
ncbi:sulfotransferase family 2 domain-containing protein [Bacillus megaterium]|nr:sulfotransferase family 2 domain-containing protein [Priestia megaterium]